MFLTKLNMNITSKVITYFFKEPIHITKVTFFCVGKLQSSMRVIRVRVLLFFLPILFIVLGHTDFTSPIIPVTCSTHFIERAQSLRPTTRNTNTRVHINKYFSNQKKLFFFQKRDIYMCMVIQGS